MSAASLARLPRPFQVSREGDRVVVMIGGVGVSLTPADARKLAIAIRAAARGAA